MNLTRLIFAANRIIHGPIQVITRPGILELGKSSRVIPSAIWASPIPAADYYHLYLNGMYWGLFQTQERAEARFAADYFGGSKEDYDVVKVSTEIGGIEATDGNMDSWQKIYNMCTKGFPTMPIILPLREKIKMAIRKKEEKSWLILTT